MKWALPPPCQLGVKSSSTRASIDTHPLSFNICKEWRNIYVFRISRKREGRMRERKGERKERKEGEGGRSRGKRETKDGSVEYHLENMDCVF